MTHSAFWSVRQSVCMDWAGALQKVTLHLVVNAPVYAEISGMPSFSLAKSPGLSILLTIYLTLGDKICYMVITLNLPH